MSTDPRIEVMAEHFAAVTGEPRAGRFEYTMARAALDAADKAATITTVEGLDSLPVGAVILDGDPAVLEMKEKSSIYGSTWWMAGSDYEYTSGKITLPARVIHWGQS